MAASGKLAGACPHALRHAHNLRFARRSGGTRRLNATDFPEADFWPGITSGLPVHPPKIDAKCGDHFLQADYSLLKPVR